MSDENTSAQRPTDVNDPAADPGFEPFSDTEVKCQTCGMNIVREPEEMGKHRDFHAAADAAGADSGTP